MARCKGKSWKISSLGAPRPRLERRAPRCQLRPYGLAARASGWLAMVMLLDAQRSSNTRETSATYEDS
jgi:hypothetical protein